MAKKSLLLCCNLGDDRLELLLDKRSYFSFECIRDRARIRAERRHCRNSTWQSDVVRGAVREWFQNSTFGLQSLIQPSKSRRPATMGCGWRVWRGRWTSLWLLSGLCYCLVWTPMSVVGIAVVQALEAIQSFGPRLVSGRILRDEALLVPL